VYINALLPCEGWKGKDKKIPYFGKGASQANNAVICPLSATPNGLRLRPSPLGFSATPVSSVYDECNGSFALACNQFKPHPMRLLGWGMLGCTYKKILSIHFINLAQVRTHVLSCKITAMQKILVSNFLKNDRFHPKQKSSISLNKRYQF
jgi:hypothetical protein